MKLYQGYLGMSSAILASKQPSVSFGFRFFQNPAMKIPSPAKDLISEHP